MNTYRKHESGAREVFEPALYRETHPGADVATCGSCGRHWDDAHPSGVTPAPAARCPFEAWHKPVPVKRKMICPNCTKPIAEEHLGCLLHDLIQVLRDRDNTPERTLRRLQRDCNVDHLWNDLGRIADALEDGGYSEDDDE